MNRNVESGFAYNPTSLDMKRSRFDRNSSHKTTFNVGELIPFYVDEVLPGDTFDITSSKVIRLQTPLTPFMDNLYVDFYWFFVPNRLVWNHWKEFNGENTSGYWYPQVQYSVPQLYTDYQISGTGISVGSVADYMGIPLFTPDATHDFSVNALPFRCYGLIYSEWFRDQNLIAPPNIPLTDTNQPIYGSRSDHHSHYNAFPYKVAKYHDYFTSCLPAPQKGPSVEIPIELGNIAPVVTGYDHALYSVDGVTTGGIPLQNFRTLKSDGTAVTSSYDLVADGTTGNVHYGASSTTHSTAAAYPSNLWADLEANFTSTTINELRLAFQIQKLYEKDARGGTRYVEMLKSHFGVTSPDYRLQRPEYLGGNRVPINVNQVVQSSETTSTSPMGNTGAMSVTSDVHSDFTKSFTEHGFVIGLCCARYDHTYQQGIERFWSRKTRFDYYYPVLANIGEQPVLNKEIYVQGNSTDDEVFGYQEAWADYRYKPSRVSGEMRSGASTSLDVWHLADNYNSLPYLSQTWIQEDYSNVDRVLAVTSQVSNQLFMDCYVKNRTTRIMPLYSIPGLIDHH